MTDKLQLRVPKLEDVALAGRDALRPVNLAPFLLGMLVVALLTNILTAAAAAAVFAYVSALWNRARTDTDTQL